MAFGTTALSDGKGLGHQSVVVADTAQPGRHGFMIKATQSLPRSSLRGNAPPRPGPTLHPLFRP